MNELLKYMIPAEEGLLDNRYTLQFRKSKEMETANTMYKTARKLYYVNSREKAINYMTKAKVLYEGVLKKAEKAADMMEVEREVKLDDRHKDTRKAMVTMSKPFAYLIKFLNERIISCKAYLMQWENDKNIEDVKRMREELKKELSEEKAIYKAAKKGKNEIGVTESYFDEAFESTLFIWKMEDGLDPHEFD